MNRIFGLRSGRLVVAALAIFAVAGGIAYAAIPDAAGVFHGCVAKNGQLSIIDPSSDKCKAHDTEIAFNQQGTKGDPGSPGAQGPPGTNGADGTDGVSPTVAQLGPNDSHCLNGGAAITDASGTTAYVCNGANGADGQPFSGTFTSPNHQYSIAVADTGVTISGPDTTVAVSATGLRVDTHASSSVVVMSSNNLTLKSGGTATLQAGSTLDLRGALLLLNAPGACGSAARIGDFITVASGGTTGMITTGSPTVCIGG